MTLRPRKAAAGGACDESDMTRHARDCFDPAPCPTDLCCFGECQCAPSAAQGDQRRLIMQAFGLAAAALAVAGLVVPLLPTTPFVLVSAWAFARSSPRLEAWLRNHDRLGPPLKAWEQRGAIPRGAKAVAAVSLPISGVLVHASGAGLAVTATAGVALACVGGWILTRPS
ncbi:MAG: YbaN family protein [Brevundimonas sp.]|uniref:YbaN family protein n=1 Tax=Brevundimonas sp. TaxID=1871086 RepID=UPI00248A25B4|nr:YbaN family protein [Brevundimonas sp.]MDI1328097.1 YbaN family protein [Brevundimonas sp.]